MKLISGGVCAAKGYKANGIHCGIRKNHSKKDLALIVSVAPLGGDESVIYASTLANKDTMRILVTGHEKQTMVTALFDNLGKGASGAAIQNMNIMLGLDETTGLNL